MSDELDEELDDDSDPTSKLVAFMDDHDDDFLDFEAIEVGRRFNQRPDINAFLLLDSLVRGNRDMVSAAEHDVIYLDIEPHELMKAASEEDLLDLIRCGVRYDSSADSLAMFV